MEFFYAAINLLVIIVTAIGAGLGVWGVINLLEAYSQENSNNKNQGIRQLMAGGGIILVAQVLIPMLANVF